MGEQHETFTSRQCKGMSDPEGDSPSGTQEPCSEADGYKPRGNKFDNPAPDCTKEDQMEEEHTSRTR
jgi:hypothetical protein